MSKAERLGRVERIPPTILRELYVQLDYSSREISGLLYGNKGHYKFVLMQLKQLGIPRISRRKETGFAKKWRDGDITFQQNRLSKLRAAKASPEHRAVMRKLWTKPDYLKQHLDAWSDQGVKALRISKVAKILAIRPTSPEKRVIGVIAKYNLPFKYTGDGRFIIAGINPDFVNVNGEKIAVEVFGDRWHKGEYVKPVRTEEGRRARLTEYGWKLVVLWTSDMEKLTDQEIADRLVASKS